MATNFAEEPIEEPNEAAAAEDSESTDTSSEATKDEAVPAAGPTARKAMATKEVIPFAWKLVGYSGGTPVTLFKAVEREDVEVQLVRVERDGYYKDLKILDVNTKVEQPKPIVAAIEPKEVAKKAVKTAGKTSRKKRSAEKPSLKTASKGAKTPLPKKATVKSTSAAAKKKKNVPTKTAKRKAKKR